MIAAAKQFSRPLSRKIFMGVVAFVLSLLTVFLGSQQQANAYIIQARADYNVWLAAGGGSQQGWVRCDDGYVVTSVQVTRTTGIVSGGIINGLSFTCSQLKSDLTGFTGLTQSRSVFGSGANTSACPAGYVADGLNGYQQPYGFQFDLGVKCEQLGGSGVSDPNQAYGSTKNKTFSCPAGYWLTGMAVASGGGVDKITHESCVQYRFNLYAPTSVTVSTVSNSTTKLSVSWTNPDSATPSNVVLVRNSAGATVQTINNARSPLTISNLTGGTTYSILVQAKGDGVTYGDSTWSTPVSGTPIAQMLRIQSRAIASIAGTPWAQQPIIQAIGPDDQVANVSVPVTATLTGGPVLTGTKVVTTSAGRASYSDLNWTGPAVGGIYTLTYSSPGYQSISHRVYLK
ncbi:MAG: hypothetical protein RI933_287, partial [Actinomycetota bacterium]